jgi:single-strand DNA-binding protein
MAGETVITVVGNLTDDPELRFTPSGAAVANFTVASTPRNFNKQTNEWEDGEAMFLRCSIWRQAAENVAESLQRGMRVVVQGRLRARTWETREGEKRTSFEVDVEEIGPSLKFATAKVNRVSRGGGGGYSGGGQAAQSGGQSADDPWATPAPAAGQPAPAGGAPANDPWGAPGTGSDDPPF